MGTRIASILITLAIPLGGQTVSDFAGHWRQLASSRIQRQLEVEQSGNSLRVKTEVIGSKETRELEVKYEIGGPKVSYTGLDGDSFSTAVHWEGRSLVFETTERESGSDIPQKVVWTLSEDGKTLHVDRSITKSGKTTNSQSTYTRQR